MSTISAAAGSVGAEGRAISRAEERRVIIASSVGTVFEWYDFYLYATPAPFFAALFFPKGNDTAALLSAFATYAAGFLVRPFGAIVFGRIGDLVGRKYTFLVTIIVMGSATALVGFLPTYQSIGLLAPTFLVALRLAQGLALGGEYWGAATYVAEHAPDHRRGYATSWILVELFPTRIRYTSMSLPYHIGNGWFGGMLPLLATAMVAESGDIYFGLWYPIAVSVVTVVIGGVFLRETKDRRLEEESG